MYLIGIDYISMYLYNFSKYFEFFLFTLIINN